MTVFAWTMTLVSLVGVVLNIHRHQACFILWLVTNLSWVVIDLSYGIPAQAALQLVYAALSLWGLWKWSHDSGRT